MKIKTNQDDYKLLTDTIRQWTESRHIDDKKAEELIKTIEKPKTTSQQIAQYFFFIALSCILLAFVAIFIDDKFLEKLKLQFALTNMFVAVLFTILSIVWLYFLNKKRNVLNIAPFEIYAVVGGMLVVTAVTYFCKELGEGPKYSGLLFTISVLLFIISTKMRSQALWIAATLALMGWFGAFSSWFSTNDLFLGMNYPVRFSAFGLLIILSSFIQTKIKPIIFSQRLTYIAGMVIFFTAVWGVSIFGNYSNLEEWASVRQTHVIWYALVFAITGVVSFLLGIKYKDNFARDLGVIALLANLYTRYFEYFWDNTNKGLFFLLLAVSFWFIGKRLEKIRQNSNLIN